MSAIIEVKDLKKTYGKLEALKGISFSVEKGGLFALLGLNGAGKSTTINILCQIIQKDSGKVFINGLDLDHETNKIKKHIGIVFQNSVLDKELTVYENLLTRAGFYLFSPKEAKARINELAELLDFKAVLKQTYGTLSGGQRRKVDIARGLIHKPDILFLDEPTTGLDPNTRVQVWELLKDLVLTTDLTIFLTTHYLEEVRAASKIIIIDEGKIALEGKPAELLEKYSQDILKIHTPVSKEIEEILTKEGFKFGYLNDSYEVETKNSLEALELIKRHEDLFGDFEFYKGNFYQVFYQVTGKMVKKND